jgi:hypothetical protein
LGLSDLQARLADLPTAVVSRVFSKMEKDDAYDFAIRMAKSGDLSIMRWMQVNKFPLGTTSERSCRYWSETCLAWRFMCEVAWKAESTVNVDLFEWLLDVAKRPFFLIVTRNCYSGPGNVDWGCSLNGEVVWMTVSARLAEKAMISGIEALPVAKWLQAQDFKYESIIYRERFGRRTA